MRFFQLEGSTIFDDIGKLHQLIESLVPWLYRRGNPYLRDTKSNDSRSWLTTRCCRWVLASFIRLFFCAAQQESMSSSRAMYADNSNNDGTTPRKRARRMGEVRTLFDGATATCTRDTHIRLLSVVRDRFLVVQPHERTPGTRGIRLSRIASIPHTHTHYLFSPTDICVCDRI